MLYQKCERCGADDGLERRVGSIEWLVLCVTCVLELRSDEA